MRRFGILDQLCYLFTRQPQITRRRIVAEARKALGAGAHLCYPLLIGEEGETHVPVKSRWLANRTFVGIDTSGRIIIGTTKEAFFTLDRLATFLKSAPLDLKLVLNLDGGPIACQSVRLPHFQRKFYAQWEAQVNGNRVQLLRWPFAGQTWAMSIALTVERK